MRVLLVTLAEILPFALAQVLNPAQEYCAIVIDDTKAAKSILKEVPLLQNRVYPFYELKECTEKISYDCLLCVSDAKSATTIGEQLRKYVSSTEKILHVCLANTSENFFLLERALRYYAEHVTDFEIFATGISYVCQAIDADRFSRKVFNFGRGSQDLYYDYQIAKFALTQAGGGWTH